MVMKLKKLKVDEGSLVDKGANEDALVVFFKRHEDIGKTGHEHLSPKEKVWVTILERAQALQNTQEDWSANAKGIMSAEQKVAAFLKTSEGGRLYNQYTAASDERPAMKRDAPDDEPKTLNEYAWKRLDAIAKKTYPSLTPEAATAKASREHSDWRQLYSV